MSADSKGEELNHTEARHSRREFLKIALAAPAAPNQVRAARAVGGRVRPGREPARESTHAVLEVNYRRLLERADLRYERPPARSEGLCCKNSLSAMIALSRYLNLSHQVSS